MEEAESQVLPRVAEKMRYKEILKPYIARIYKNDYDTNFLLKNRCENLIKNFEECGKEILISEHQEILGAKFCHQRICPICNYRKSTKTWHKMHEIVSHLENKDYVLITLTVKNCNAEILAKTLSELLQSFKRLTNRKTWQKAFTGYFRGVEITYNAKENTYHPHIHVLAHCSNSYFRENYIDNDKLRQMWQKSARLNYYVQTDIRKVENNKKGIAEVAKYAVKMSSILETTITSQKLKAVQILNSVLYKRRLVALGGDIKKVAQELNIDIESDEEPEEKAGEWYKYNKGKYERKNVRTYVKR